MAAREGAEDVAADATAIGVGYGLFVIMLLALLAAPWAGYETALAAPILALMAAVFLSLLAGGTLPAVPPKRSRRSRGLIARQRTKYSGIRFLPAASLRPRLPGS